MPLADTDPLDIFLACFFLLIFVLAGFYAVYWLRKRIWGVDDSARPSLGFTIGDLRDLHRTGKLTDEEFQKAKQKIVTSLQSPPAPPQPPDNP